MAFANPDKPSLADFIVFLNTSVQIPVSALPADSPWPGYAYAQAIELVIGCGGILYTLAVYNLATALLFQITPDVDGQTYFSDKRSDSATGYGLNQPSVGIVVSSSDEGTSTSLTAPTWAAGLTISQLTLMKTPWGREYLGYEQSYGSVIVGLT